MATKPKLTAEVIGLDYQVCPRNQGQIVTYAYASDGKYVYCRRHDGSDGDVSYSRSRLAADDDGTEYWQIEPKNKRWVNLA